MTFLASSINFVKFCLPEWIFDVYVPIQRDSTQIEDAGGAAHDIESYPGVAKLGSENPVTQ